MKIFFTLLLFFISINLFGQKNKLIVNLKDNSSEEYLIEDLKEINIINEYVAVEDFYFRSLYFVLSVGNTGYIDYVFVPENATNKKIIWEVEKPEIASVNDSGLVRGLKPGKTEIYGTSEELGRKSTFLVDVEGPASVKISENDIKIYPNPIDNYLNIETEITSFEVIIYNLNGQILFSDYDKKTIDLSYLSSGNYLITLRINDEYYTYNFTRK